MMHMLQLQIGSNYEVALYIDGIRVIECIESSGFVMINVPIEGHDTTLLLSCTDGRVDLYLNDPYFNAVPIMSVDNLVANSTVWTKFEFDLVPMISVR